MKHIIILGDGMADWHRDDLGGKTLLQYADVPHMDWLARNGRNGLLKTVPDGFHPGSEVANSSILGYDQHKVYEGRGPLEAASIGVTLEEGDLALRCNLICVEGDILKNHSCGRLETEEGDTLIRYLEKELGNDRIHFYTGVQYRHLLVIKGGDKRIDCTPPHDVPLQTWADKLPKAQCPEAEETARLLGELIRKSQELLPQHPLNRERARKGMDMASSIWPWGGGFRPQMKPLTEIYPQIRRGSVITIVLFSLMYILVGADAAVSHFVKHEPVQEWEYYAWGLMVIILIVSIVIAKTNLMEKMCDRLHNFLTREGWHILDRMIFKDMYDDETDE